MSEPCILAAIDAGSNAIRVLIVEASAGHVVPLLAERVPVRLGRGTFSSGRLRNKTIDEAVATFTRFRALFDQHGVSAYRAVATSAVRSAKNRERLIDLLFRQAHIDLEVIDGAEEGRLVRRAVMAQYQKGRKPDAILDLGGGSLEMMRRAGSAWNCESTNVGTVRLLESFGLSGAISDDEARMLQRFVKASLRSGFGPELLDEGIEKTVLCGGNAECLAELFGEEVPKGGRTLSFKRLNEELEEITSRDTEERMSEFKVRKDRAEVMGVAAIVLATLGKVLGLDSYHAPGVGIRDGIILDLHEAEVGEHGGPSKVAGLAAARAFAERLGHNSNHGEQVRHIAKQLFEELAPLHELPDQCHAILLASALLHDVGEVVHRKAHHKHSEYLIMNGRIPGIEGSTRAMVAATARAHRKSMPHKRKHETFGSLESKEQVWVSKMAVLLRLADSLDSSRRGRKIKLKADIGNKKVSIEVSAKDAGLLTGDRLQMHQEEFKEVFDRELVLREIKS
jgi:exopolyphosphatase/guanosine-5'-triphosphate,3'-diphosphate pyrophosphatase